MSTTDQRRTAVVIEDDPGISALVMEVFESAGLRAIAVDNGIDGVEAVRIHQPAVTTLDVNMSGIDGFETARRIRLVSKTFIIMITGLSEEADVVLGLGAGADEYVVKPFRPRELRARIEVALRRSALDAAGANTAAAQDLAASSEEKEHWRHHRGLRVNCATRTVIVAGSEIELTPSEFDLLAALVESKRRVRSKSDLTLVLRGDEAATSYYVGEADKRAVEAHMANLRHKLGDTANDPEYIETVRGVGYRLTP